MNIGKGRKLYPGEKKCKHEYKAVIKHNLVTDVAQFTGGYRIVFSLHLRKRKYKLILTSWKMRFVFNYYDKKLNKELLKGLAAYQLFVFTAAGKRLAAQQAHD